MKKIKKKLRLERSTLLQLTAVRGGQNMTTTTITITTVLTRTTGDCTLTYCDQSGCLGP